MNDEMSENVGTTNDTDPALEQINRYNTILTRIDNLSNRIGMLEDNLTEAQHANTQTLRTVMVGWNAFLKSAEAQLKGLFKGTIPAPLLRKLVQTAFKGLEDMERKGK